MVMQEEMVKAYAMLGTLAHRRNYSHVRTSQLPASGAIRRRRR
jgi:hypothetical protein